MIPPFSLDWIPLLRGLLATLGLGCTTGLIAVTVASSLRQRRAATPGSAKSLHLLRPRTSTTSELVGAS